MQMRFKQIAAVLRPSGGHTIYGLDQWGRLWSKRVSPEGNVVGNEWHLEPLPEEAADVQEQATG